MRSLCSTGFFQKILFSYFLMNNEKLLGCVLRVAGGGGRVGCRREKREGGGAGNFSFNISCHSWAWII